MDILQENHAMVNICFENSFLKQTDNRQNSKGALDSGHNFCKIN